MLYMLSFWKRSRAMSRSFLLRNNPCIIKLQLWLGFLLIGIEAREIETRAVATIGSLLYRRRDGQSALADKGRTNRLAQIGILMNDPSSSASSVTRYLTPNQVSPVT